jgi:head-tail adaptor
MGAAANAAGALNTLVTLEAPQTTPDGAGGETIVWNPIATLWADLKPMGGGRERYGYDGASGRQRKV